ncbi:MAG TPA: hypothetical protein VGH54_19850 [Mycobacterium sp.]|jgi:hypothetical protein|uniref:hypothetical protein n=1 Tax=Mycobacterium sp. TaxID=1785 RepID=UPI002F3FF215
MTDSEPDGITLRTRTLGHVHTDDDTVVVVEHVYEPEGAAPCGDCGGPAHDPGMVGLVISGEREDGTLDVPVSALLTAEDALVLANRLQRAASLVLESGEDCPDIEREAARFAPPEGPAGDA